MRVLLIKTSSLGDIIHTFPALSDARKQLPEIEFDWVVEEAFAELPHWHPAVRRVIPIAWRRWRKTLWRAQTWQQMKQFRRQLLAREYDAVIDAQGLLKSALISRLLDNKRYGLDKDSAREAWASYCYDHPIAVARGQHAVLRLRQLFARIFHYAVDEPLNYGISQFFTRQSAIRTVEKARLGVLFFHATTWQSKHWPLLYWQQLAALITANGYQVWLPWGNAGEYQNAQFIANRQPQVIVLPRQSLTQLAQKIAQSSACVAVDTGLAQLAAALGKPQLSLFGATRPVLTRPYGASQEYLKVKTDCAGCLKKHCSLQKIDRDGNTIQPMCYADITPQQVWEKLQEILDR